MSYTFCQKNQIHSKRGNDNKGRKKKLHFSIYYDFFRPNNSCKWKKKRLERKVHIFANGVNTKDNFKPKQEAKRWRRAETRFWPETPFPNLVDASAKKSNILTRFQRLSTASKVTSSYHEWADGHVPWELPSTLRTHMWCTDAAFP